MTQRVFRVINERVSLTASLNSALAKSRGVWDNWFLVLTLAPPSARRIPHWILLAEAAK